MDNLYEDSIPVTKSLRDEEFWCDWVDELRELMNKVNGLRLPGYIIRDLETIEESRQNIEEWLKVDYFSQKSL